MFQGNRTNIYNDNLWWPVAFTPKIYNGRERVKTPIYFALEKYFAHRLFTFSSTFKTRIRLRIANIKFHPHGMGVFSTFRNSRRRF